MAADIVFRIEMLPARHGDCIVVTYGPADGPALVLIDGGPSTSYATLAQRLSQLKKPLRALELMVITHIDSDHIGGAVKLLGDRELGVLYKDLWFNGWEQLRERLEGWRYEAPKARAATRSAIEGHHVALRVKQAGRAWNATFGGRAVCVARGADGPEVLLEHGMKLTLLSPDVAALEELRTSWRKALQRAGVDPDDTEAVARKLAGDRRYRGARIQADELSGGLVHELATMAPELDDAVANGSSIAFVAEYEGRRVAFLGDAHMPLVEAAVRRLAKRYGEPRLKLDAVKVAHHGSKGNTTSGFLKAIDCADYLISTDGSQFGHPDDEAIARIVEYGGKPTTLHFNYLTPRTQRWADSDLQARLGYRARYAADGTGTVLDLLQ